MVAEAVGGVAERCRDRLCHSMPFEDRLDRAALGPPTKQLLGRVALVDLTYSEEDQAFRAEVRTWLEEHLTGEWAALRGLGGAGRDHEAHDERLAWNRLLAEHGWTCVGWPKEYGGRGLSLVQQVIFHEEYAKADAPVRVNHLGEELLGPTLMAFGTQEQKDRFLPKIVAVEELWAQGYSEPNAGSDLANVQTKARLDGDDWVVDGQKVWTSNAHFSQWAFVVCRTEPGSRAAPRPLLPAGAPRPGRRRRTPDRAADRRVGVQRGLLHRRAHRRGPGGRRARRGLEGRDGAARLRARRLGARPGRRLRAGARRRRRPREVQRRDRRPGPARPPRRPQGRARGDAPTGHAWTVVRTTQQGRRSSSWSGRTGTSASARSPWTSSDPRGLTTATAEGYDLDRWQRLFLFSLADTIYGGSDEVQRNILAERVLGLPREARG